jgi:replicative DNA helicase
MGLFHDVLNDTNIRLSQAGCPARLTAPDRTTPAALDRERLWLGAVGLGSDQRLVVAELLPPSSGSWFYDKRHGLIYDACLTFFERREPIDLHSVTDVLHRRGHLEKVGGSLYLAELTESVVSTANVAHHARIIREKALFRSLINIGSEISASAYEQDDLQEIIARAHQQLLQAANTQSTSSFTTMQELMSQSIHEAQHAGQHVLTGVDTGFHDLNSLTGGFQPSDLIILAARPGQGKSALATHFATAAAASCGGLPVAVFSLEMSKSQLAMRLLCSEARIDSQRVRRGFTSQPEGGQLMNAGNRLQEVSETSRDFKIPARELHVPVLARSQHSRTVEGRHAPMPQLSALSASGYVSGETLLRTATGGRARIADLVGTTPIVGSYDTVTGRTGHAQCLAVCPRGVKPVFEISTGMGRNVRATADHRFWTRRGWVRVDRLHIGDHLGVAVMPQSLEAAQTISDDELALLGHVIGNGCILPRHASQYTTRHEDLAHLVADLAARVFGADVSPRVEFSNPRAQSGWYNTFFASTRRHTHGVRSAVSEWAEWYGLFGRRSWERRIPERMFEQPEAAIQHFVRHLWVTDGSVGGRREDPQPHICYATSSEGLARDVQSLLLRLRLLTSISEVEQGPHRPSFTVRLVGGKEGYERFLSLGTVGAYHQARHVQVANRVHAICGRSSTTYRIEDGLVFDPIRAIEPCGDEPVFDAAVPSTECMQANDFIASNAAR